MNTTILVNVKALLVIFNFILEEAVANDSFFSLPWLAGQLPSDHVVFH